MDLSLPDISNLFTSGEIFKNILSSVILVLVAIVTRIALLRAISKIKSASESKLEWKSHIKMLTNTILMVGILIIWGTELRVLALSLFAVAVALVIATKELILCFMGGLLKSLSRPFKVGDRIEIDKYRGDVIEHDLLTTTLFEIGPAHSSHLYTGRRIVFPNSLFLAQGLINETKRFKFGLHTFVVSLPQTIDVEHHKKALLNAANEVCGGMIEQAQEFLDDLGDLDGIEAPNAGPKVSVSFASGTSIDLIVRIPIPSLKSERTEQQVLEKYIEKRESTMK